jgi:hypothetical protein
MSRLFLFIALFIVCSSSTIQVIEDRKLTWSDFKGTPDPNSRFHAMTYSDVYYKYDPPVIKGDKALITFKTWCEFNPKKSWVKTTPAKDRTELLKHEQGHYDLFRICSRDLKKRLSSSVYSAANYKQEVRNIFNKTFSEYEALQRKYDEDTNHMQNRPAQLKWDKWIAKKLIEFEKYNKI